MDLGAVLEIENRAYVAPWTRGNFVDALAAQNIAEVLVDPSADLIGYFVAMVGVDELHLLNLTVSPAWQGQGLGRELLDAVGSHGRQRRLGTLWLEVRESNQRARAMYERLGFVEIHRRSSYYPAGEKREDAVVMSLALGPQEVP